MVKDIIYTVFFKDRDERKCIRFYTTDSAAKISLRSLIKKGAHEIKIYHGIGDLRPVMRSTYNKLTEGAFDDERTEK